MNDTCACRLPMPLFNRRFQDIPKRNLFASLLLASFVCLCYPAFFVVQKQVLQRHYCLFMLVTAGFGYLLRSILIMRPFDSLQLSFSQSVCVCVSSTASMPYVAIRPVCTRAFWVREFWNFINRGFLQSWTIKYLFHRVFQQDRICCFWTCAWIFLEQWTQINVTW